MELTITWFDLLVIYVLPVLAVVVVVFLKLTFLFLFIKLPIDFDFKYDLLYIYDSQKNLKRYRKRPFPFLTFYLKSMLGDSGAQALFMYRVSRWFHRLGIGFIRDWIHRFAKFFTQVDISPYAEIGRGLNIYHGSGVVIGKNTKIGERGLVCQSVTTGSGAPQIGNNVKLWAGAKVLGNITVGDNSEVGANAVLVKSLEANCIALGVPADRIIRKSQPPA